MAIGGVVVALDQVCKSLAPATTVGSAFMRFSPGPGPTHTLVTTALLAALLGLGAWRIGPPRSAGRERARALALTIGVAGVATRLLDLVRVGHDVDVQGLAGSDPGELAILLGLAILAALGW